MNQKTNIENREVLTMNDKDFITVKEASQILYGFVKPWKLYALIDDQVLEDYGTSGKKLLDKTQVLEYKELMEKQKVENITSPFGEIVLDYDESIKLLDGFHHPNNIKFPGRFISKCKYVTTNKGRIFNLNRNCELSQNPNTNQYWQVDLYINKRKASFSVHTLIALCWCPNGLLKAEVHHIDGDRKNNFAVNLVWVTKEEHTEAHRLLKIAKETNQWDEYNEYISEIKKANEWQKEYRCLAFDKENAVIVVWMEKEAYNDYLSGKRTLNEIYWYETKTDVILRKDKLGVYVFELSESEKDNYC